MHLKNKAVVFLATGFGFGCIPVIPGTFGTLPGLPLCYLLAQMPVAVAALSVVLLIAAAIWIAGEAEKTFGQKDPGKIVIDEIAGLAVALLGLPFDLFHVLTGFVVFRLIDAWKPFPLRSMEKRLSGGVGVVMDDVGAGIYTHILVRLLALVVPS
jgi:phosphatidylglycerophosphatase A